MQVCTTILLSIYLLFGSGIVENVVNSPHFGQNSSIAQTVPNGVHQCIQLYIQNKNTYRSNIIITHIASSQIDSEVRTRHNSEEY